MILHNKSFLMYDHFSLYMLPVQDLSFAYLLWEIVVYFALELCLKVELFVFSSDVILRGNALPL